MNKDILIVLGRCITLLRHQGTEDEVRAVLEMILNGLMVDGEITPEAIALNEEMSKEPSKIIIAK